MSDSSNSQHSSAVDCATIALGKSLCYSMSTSSLYQVHRWRKKGCAKYGSSDLGRQSYCKNQLQGIFFSSMTQWASFHVWNPPSIEDGILKNKSFVLFFYCCSRYLYNSCCTEHQRCCCFSPFMQTPLYHPGEKRHDYSDFSHMRNDRACHVQKAVAGKGLLVNISLFFPPDSLPVLPGASEGKWIWQ